MNALMSVVRGRTSLPRPVRLGLLGCVPVVLLLIGVHLTRAALALDPRGCPAGPEVLPDYVILAATVGVLFLGSFLGARRYRARDWAPGGDRVSSIVGVGALTLFLLASTGALIYEAVGVQQAGPQSASRGVLLQDLEPITYYVRCAIYHDKVFGSGGWWTLLAFGWTCFLVGHWLWVQTERDGPRLSSITPPALAPATASPSVEEPGRRTNTYDKLGADGVIITLVLAGFLVGFVCLGFVVSSYSSAVSGGIAARVQEATGTFHVGIAGVVMFVFAVFIAISLLDLYFEWNRWRPIGLRVQEWSRANPWFVGMLLLVLGALLAHFLANPIHYGP